MNGGALWPTVHGATKSRIRLSDFTFQQRRYKKGMKRCSTLLVRKIQVEINEIPFPTHFEGNKSKRETTTSIGKDVGKLETTHSWQECKVAQPLGNSSVVPLES